MRKQVLFFVKIQSDLYRPTRNEEKSTKWEDFFKKTKKMVMDSDIEYGNDKTFQKMQGEGRPKPCMLGQKDLEERKNSNLWREYNDYQP